MDRKGWEEHLAAAEREGKNVRRYAAEHGLSAYAMYSARRKLRKRDATSTKSATTARAVRAERGNPFATVRLAPAAPLRAQLPNGVMVELPIGAGDLATLEATINVLARLPCSV